MLFRAECKRKSIHANLKNFEQNNSLQAHKNFLLSPENKETSGGKVSSDISEKGSLTVESALILPLFFLCICTIICFMDIYRVQTVNLAKLCHEAEEAGKYAYVTGETDDVVLPKIYRYQIPISIVSLPDLIFYNSVKVHPWTGYQGERVQEDTDSEMVYVTENGGVYHVSSECSYLDLSIRQCAGSEVADLRNESGGKYHACVKCARGEDPASVVYLTDSGDCYHNEAGCSGLKRTVRLVKKSEVENLRVCSRCG